MARVNYFLGVCPKAKRRLPREAADIVLAADKESSDPALVLTYVRGLLRANGCHSAAAPAYPHARLPLSWAASERFAIDQKEPPAIHLFKCCMNAGEAYIPHDSADSGRLARAIEDIGWRHPKQVYRWVFLFRHHQTRALRTAELSCKGNVRVHDCVPSCQCLPRV